MQAQQNVDCLMLYSRQFGAFSKWTRLPGAFQCQVPSGGSGSDLASQRFPTDVHLREIFRVAHEAERSRRVALLEIELRGRPLDRLTHHG
jgi:hypothetical protein